MPVKRRHVQGAYISLEAKKALQREARRRGDFPTTLVSKILEEKAAEIIEKEKGHGKNTKD